MGHQRVGRLPRTYHWRALVKLLAESPEVGAFASDAVTAAQTRLAELKNETAVPYCYWLLVRLTTAARGEDFIGDAAAAGIEIRLEDSAIGFIARLSGQVADTLRRQPGAGPFAELAVESLRATLLDTVARQGYLPLGAPVDGLRAQLRQYGTEAGFASLAHRYFGDFISRTLRYFLDRELGDHIGPAFGLSSVEDAAAFATALDTHAWETAAIMKNFAGEWYSKHNFLSEREIRRETAAGCVAFAIEKVRRELARETRPYDTHDSGGAVHL